LKLELPSHAMLASFTGALGSAFILTSFSAILAKNFKVTPRRLPRGWVVGGVVYIRC